MSWEPKWEGMIYILSLLPRVVQVYEWDGTPGLEFSTAVKTACPHGSPQLFGTKKPWSA